MNLSILILILIVIISNVVKVIKNSNKDEFAKYTTKRKNFRTRIPSQTNELSRRVREEQEEMQELERKHTYSNCKYTYTTQDPNFSFNGLPNDYDDFAILRKKNEAHERHLQKKIY